MVLAEMTAATAWRVWVDTGGTFTDCLARDPQGGWHRRKVLSNSSLRGRVESVESGGGIRVAMDEILPEGFMNGFSFRLLKRDAPPFQVIERFESAAGRIRLGNPRGLPVEAGDSFEAVSPDEAPVLAARLVTDAGPADDMPSLVLRLATTRGTNALLEGKVAKVAFFVTRGFGDLLRIGDQRRPDLFSLRIEERRPLHARVVEVPERTGANGKVVEALDEAALAVGIEALRHENIDTAAIALLHSYRCPAAEERLDALLREKGFRYVSRSADLAPLIKLLPRAETAVADACLSPVMNEYLDRVTSGIGEGRLYIMTSAGGLVSREAFRAKDSLLSGPAGGVVGAVAAGRQAGFSRIISFDMGGTSTDVSRFDEDFEYAFEHRVGGARLMAPALKIETVAAGGGSICGFDGERLFVGPESAGARPGPACYGAGGPLTLTDIHLLLGRIDPSLFGIPVSENAAELRVSELLARVRESGREVEREGLLGGFLEIANEIMAEAIRRISVREGCDPAEYALVAFGGAGGLHACALAERLGITDIVFPADAGLLSAIGLKEAVIERIADRQILEGLDTFGERLEEALDELTEKARRALSGEGVSGTDVAVRRRAVALRFQGQETIIEIDHSAGICLEDRFQERYADLFGYAPRDRRIEVASLRVVASERSPEPEGETFPAETDESGPEPRDRLVPRDALRTGEILAGHCIVQDRYSTLVVDAGWRGLVGDRGTLRLSRFGTTEAGGVRDRPEVVNLELFTNRFRSLTEEMGIQLERTALSTNIKERRDFSCALLDENGELVVNAPHVPVHLGSLGICVRAAAKTLSLQPGDVAVTNHPGYGGSHLPDLTVITPVFLDNGVLLGYVANRAHHAEIGGARPGSMPPDARCLAEEGVVIPPMYLFRGDGDRYGEITRILRESVYPTRALEENLADLNAQTAANRRGAKGLLAMARKHGAGTVHHYWRALKRRSAEALRASLKSVPCGEYRARQELDDGTPISVVVKISDDGVEVEFSGTGRVHPGNFNATPGIVHSAVIYVLRVLVAEPIPLNEGLMERVRVRLPRCFLNPDFRGDPAKAPAVVAGNVETSQRLVDTLLLALEKVACSQGTMNNLVFGDDRVSFYETVGGGSGAGHGFDGASGVHTHMTNTAVTDPEIMEFRYPVRLWRFALRRETGGKGRWRGGDGLIRELEFLRPMRLSLLTQHRNEGPYGLGGGGAGAPGRQTVVRADGTEAILPFLATAETGKGDRLLLATPGGGGYGVEGSHEDD